MKWIFIWIIRWKCMHILLIYCHLGIHPLFFMRYYKCRSHLLGSWYISIEIFQAHLIYLDFHQRLDDRFGWYYCKYCVLKRCKGLYKNLYPHTLTWMSRFFFTSLIFPLLFLGRIIPCVLCQMLCGQVVQSNIQALKLI